MLIPLRVIIVCFLIVLWSPTLGQDAVFNISKPKIDLVGIWKLKPVDAGESRAFDYCKFTVDGEFMILENDTENKRSSGLAPDERGTWVYENDTLTVSIIGEEHGNGYEELDTPQILYFCVRSDEEYIYLQRMDSDDEARLERLIDPSNP